MLRRKALAAACGTALLFSSSAFAADMLPAPVYKAPPPVVVTYWHLEVTPYFWMPALNGSSTIKGHTSDIDASFFGTIIHRDERAFRVDDSF